MIDEVRKALTIAVAMFLVEVFVGIPFGYFSSELRQALGDVGPAVIGVGVSAALMLAVCAFFANRWPRHSFVRVLAAFVGVEVISWLMLTWTGGSLGSLALLMITGAISLACAFVGTFIGGRLGRSNPACA